MSSVTTLTAAGFGFPLLAPRPWAQKPDMAARVMTVVAIG